MTDLPRNYKDTVGVSFGIQNQVSLEDTKPETRKCVEVFGLLFRMVSGCKVRKTLHD